MHESDFSTVLPTSGKKLRHAQASAFSESHEVPTNLDSSDAISLSSKRSLAGKSEAERALIRRELNFGPSSSFDPNNKLKHTDLLNRGGTV